jgi:hypothetical protein
VPLALAARLQSGPEVAATSVGRALLAGLLLVPAALLLLPAASAAAQDGACIAEINGQSLADTGSRDPIELDVDEQASIRWVNAGEAASTDVTLEFSPFETGTVHSVGNSPEGGAWSGSVDVGEYAQYGIGLYHIAVESPNCRVEGWVKVTGRSPFTTVAGASATAVLLTGLAIQGVGLAKASRGRGGMSWAVLGAIPTGVGACVLAQQSGETPMTAQSLMGWTGVPMAIGLVSQQGFSLVGRRRREAEAGAAESGYASDDGSAFPLDDRDRPDLQAPPPDGMDGAAGAPGAEPEPDWTSAATADGGGATEATESTDEPGWATAEPPGGEGEPDWSSAPTGQAGGSAGEPGWATAEPPAAEEATAAPGPAPSAPEPPLSAPVAANGGGHAANGDPPAAAVVRDPPRTSYALLDCPDIVVQLQEFELTVGLSPKPVAGVEGGELRRPERSVGDYTLTVHLIADGFQFREGESAMLELPVTYEAPYPQTTVHLTAEAHPEDLRALAVQAAFAVDSEPMGFASRTVCVARTADLAGTATAPPAGLSIDVRAPTGGPAPDLVVYILQQESESSGRFRWVFDSPHLTSSELPLGVVECDLGDEPGQYTVNLVNKVNAQEGKPSVYLQLMGLGRQIGRKAPREFWDVLRAVAAKAGAIPSVLFLSQEPHVPWELARMDPPLLDEGAPPFLCAQAAVGRWVLGEGRPPLPPPREIEVESIGVVSGVYQSGGWARLVEAEKESASLSETYGARQVNASIAEVLAAVGAVPPIDVLHFAVHGLYDPDSPEEGLMLLDGCLSPEAVLGLDLPHAPFVFLNACQVGAAKEVLGEYAGVGPAFLTAGAAAVVAPLWSVRDTVAREVALRFYAEALAGTPVAEILRRERARFLPSPDTLTSTYLAYQYFGHPLMRLHRAENGNGG